MEQWNNDVPTRCLINTERAELSEAESVEKVEDLRTGSQTACLRCVAFYVSGVVCGAGDGERSQW